MWLNLTDPEVIAAIERALANGDATCAFTVNGDVAVTRDFRPDGWERIGWLDRKRVTFTALEDRLMLGEIMPRRVPLAPAAVTVLPVRRFAAAWNESSRVDRVFTIGGLAACPYRAGSGSTHLELESMPAPGQDYVVVLDGMLAS